MKVIILLMLAIMCSACAKDHNIPSANLSYASVVRSTSKITYGISFGSDTNILDLYGQGMREGASSIIFNCALGADQDFSKGHSIQLTAIGAIDVDESNRAAGRFNYVSNVFLYETNDRGSLARNLSIKELNSLLSDKKNIPCKVVITAYGYKPYYSNTLNIPTADLLREINKP